MRLILSWAGETLAASTFLKQMNPQEEKKKLIIQNRRDLLLVLSPFGP